MSEGYFARLEERFHLGLKGEFHFFGQFGELFDAFGVYIQVFRTLKLLLNEMPPFEVEHSINLTYISRQEGVADPQHHVPKLLALGHLSEFLDVGVVQGYVRAVVSQRLQR